jgi:hypothetical protein
MSLEGRLVQVGRAMLDDRAFVEAFESGRLSPDLFHHRDHVRLAWIFLRRMPVLDALSRFSDGLKRYATSLGKADRYHQTITWAFLLLINERMARGEAATFEAFAADNADLLTWSPSVLSAYYREETLTSPLARRTFLLPDRLQEELGPSSKSARAGRQELVK